jgi:hypothetical protein
MRTSPSPPSLLRGFRVWIPLVIGLSVSIYLLYSNLNEVRFVEVAENESGTHSWVDSNNNGLIEHWLEEDFVPSENGNFRKQKHFGYPSRN